MFNKRTNSLRLHLRRRDPSAPKGGDAAVKACVEIATSSVNAMFDYHFSALKHNSERYAIVTWLPAPMATVTSVIMSPKTEPSTMELAVATFEKAVRLLEDIAPGFILGRQTLQRLSNVVKAAQARIAELAEPASLHQHGMTATTQPLPDVALEDMLFSLDCDEIFQNEGLALMGGSPRQSASIMNWNTNGGGSSTVAA